MEDSFFVFVLFYFCFWCVLPSQTFCFWNNKAIPLGHLTLMLRDASDLPCAVNASTHVHVVQDLRVPWVMGVILALVGAPRTSPLHTASHWTCWTG